MDRNEFNRQGYGPEGLMRVRPFAALILLALFMLPACASTNQAKGASAGVEELYSKAMTSYQDGSYRDAEAYFKGIMEDHPLSPYSVEAQLMLGDIYYAQERYEDAGSYYTTFVTLHPTHHKAPYALFQKGMSYFKELLSLDRDQTTTKKALFTFEDFIKTYPESPYIEKAEELVLFFKRRLAESEFYVGKFYYNDKNYKGAISRFAVIVKNYPDVGLTDKALYYIGECYSGLGEEERARDVFTTLVTEFPESPFASIASDRLMGG
jgi:outer membrane protein assembly factor BamD